ncbi:FAD-dependent oxidoreductase [Microvirga yunnanensis]|uniref:FAD-dependent oxidoreductase n=1 Tax=Microvirga yunnanensis TaxID=2953740 RepID=UPI0021C62E38|nr:FAD-dependent oxidoreductase [Microvirga sp. HBU65207]
MASICIIGGGMVGLALATEAVRRGHKVRVYEAGGEMPGESNLETGGVNAEGTKYFDISQTRVSALGGTSHIWGGNCRFFEAEDFEPLAENAPSWLINRSDIEPYFTTAETLLHLGGTWDPADYFNPAPPVGPYFKPSIYKLSPVLMPEEGPRRRGSSYIYLKDKLKGVEIFPLHMFSRFVHRGEKITSAQFLTNDGRVVEDNADHFILACGGLENNRQLLIQAQNTADLFSRVADNVGHFWSEHPHPFLAQALFSDGNFKEYAGSYREPTYDFVFTTKFSLADRRSIDGPALSHTMQLVYRGEEKPQYLTAINEQLPLRENRIELSSEISIFDKLPLLRLHYNSDVTTRSRIWNAMMLFAAYAGSHDETRLKLALDQATFLNPELGLGGGHHHMGGTCMGSLESGGVIDRDCRVYGTENLYMAGSSVFPRGGSVNPTMNAIAIGLRTVHQLS